MTLTTRHLLSPNRRRIVDVTEIGKRGAEQLLSLKWTPYAGPGKATQGEDEHATRRALNANEATGANLRGTRNGWVIPLTDPDIDADRLTRTGLFVLGAWRG